jgi:hypothetical protein
LSRSFLIVVPWLSFPVASSIPTSMNGRFGGPLEKTCTSLPGRDVNGRCGTPLFVKPKLVDMQPSWSAMRIASPRFEIIQ